MTPRLCMLAALTIPAAASAAVNLLAQEPPAASAAAAPDTMPAGGLGQGIKVRGHWTIAVRNPDGSLVSHHEFENKLLVPGDPTYPSNGVGNSILAALLGRQSSAGFWEVQLHGVNIELCVDGTAPVTHGCIITEPGAAGVGRNYFKNLTVTVDLQAGTVTLKGSARKTTEGIYLHPLTHVSTALRTCDRQIAPATPCTSQQGGGNFTATTAPPGILVAFDQTVDVTVVLSFS